MGTERRKRAIRRQCRQADNAATARNWFRHGLTDAATYRHLDSLTMERLAQVQAHALSVARRPRHKDYAAAHMTLGALAKLLQNRATEAATSG